MKLIYRIEFKSILNIERFLAHCLKKGLKRSLFSEGKSLKVEFDSKLHTPSCKRNYSINIPLIFNYRKIMGPPLEVCGGRVLLIYLFYGHTFFLKPKSFRRSSVLTRPSKRSQSFEMLQKGL